MTNDTGSGQEKVVYDKNKSNIIDPEHLEEETPERKDQFLKRMKKEQEVGKKAFVTVDEWLEVRGQKVIRKLRNASGSEYSVYWFNGKRHKAEFAMLRKKGFMNFGDPDTQDLRKIPLRFVDGKAFKLKA